MNKQEQQHAIGEQAAQSLPNGHPYSAPWCGMIPYQSEDFVCATIEHQASLSTEEEWEADEEIEGDYSDYDARFDWQ